MTRREFVGLLLAYAGAAAIGAIGGMTDTRTADDEEPP